MAWRTRNTTLLEGEYPTNIGELYNQLQDGVVNGTKNYIQISDQGNNSLQMAAKMKEWGIYGERGFFIEAGLDLDNNSFNSFCSNLPGILSGIDVYESKKNYLKVELNLGRVAEEKEGVPATSYRLHVGYEPALRDYVVSLIIPEGVRRKIKKIGPCSTVDSTLSEADQALLIKEAALTEGFEEPKKEKDYKCISPVCPPPMRMDTNELTDFIKRSPWITMQGDYWGQRMKYIDLADSEFVYVEATPNRISVEGLSNRSPYNCADFSSGKLLSPIFASTGIDLSGDSQIRLYEKYTGRIDSGLDKLDKWLTNSDGALAKIGREVESGLGIGKAMMLTPIAVATLFGGSLYATTIGHYLTEKRQREAFFVDKFQKAGVNRPKDNECIVVVDNTCMNKKYEERKNAGILLTEERAVLPEENAALPAGEATE